MSNRKYQNIPWEREALKLGSIYRVKTRWGMYHDCQFIKTTRKGYNFLVLKTSKCLIIPKHLYDRNFSGKDIPNRTNILTVTLPVWIKQVVLKKEKRCKQN